jgi:hypothetical protein
MFARFRQAGSRLQVSAVETHRVAGRVRHEHVASLGSIAVPQTARARLEFWAKLHQRLAKLSNRINGEAQGKLLGAIHGRIPMVTLDEQAALKRANAEADERFWSGRRDTQAATAEDLKRLIATSEQSVIQASAAAAESAAAAATAKERLEKLDRGEDVPGGLFDKPMTHKEWLKAVGWTESDLRHARSLGVIDDAGLWKDLMSEILRRKSLAEKSTARVFMKRLGKRASG